VGLTSGIPQGCVLGPLQFILYMPPLGKFYRAKTLIIIVMQMILRETESVHLIDFRPIDSLSGADTLLNKQKCYSSKEKGFPDQKH